VCSTCCSVAAATNDEGAFDADHDDERRPRPEITDVYGEVFGLTVRSRNAFSQLGAGLKSMLGGELKGMTKALADSRVEVTQRMVEEAEAKGANAIVAMRFDTSEMGETWTEICAYGTAVRISKA
jgi:uncharacterized protein YbjQ (UPF0145 family)